MSLVLPTCKEKTEKGLELIILLLNKRVVKGKPVIIEIFVKDFEILLYLAVIRPELGIRLVM